MAVVERRQRMMARQLSGARGLRRWLRRDQRTADLREQAQQLARWATASQQRLRHLDMRATVIERRQLEIAEFDRAHRDPLDRGIAAVTVLADRELAAGRTVEERAALGDRVADSFDRENPRGAGPGRPEVVDAPARLGVSGRELRRAWADRRVGRSTSRASRPERPRIRERAPDHERDR